MLVLPRIGMPAARSRAVTVASYGERQPSRIFDPHVVGMSTVVNTSLSASGTPASGDGSCSPAASALSTAAAADSACSAATCRNARYRSSVAAIWSRQAWVISVDDSSLAAILAASVAASEPDDVRHWLSPRICGTAKRPSTASGASASASCWVRHGVVSSGRVTLTSLSGLSVGSTPVTSTAWIWLTWVRMASSWPA